MRLLISIAAADEIGAALEGGAQILDVKNPALGSLGRADVEVVHGARAAAPPRVTVSAALGDRLPRARDGLVEVADLGTRLAREGAALLKVGLQDITAEPAKRALAELHERLAASSPLKPGLVAVAFADGSPGEGVRPEDLLEVALSAGVEGAMLDTLRKGRSIFRILGEIELRRWIESIKDGDLLCGLAGSLAVEEAARAAALGADVVGLRGAVCAGGRTGRVLAARVRRARAAIERAAAAVAPCS